MYISLNRLLLLFILSCTFQVTAKEKIIWLVEDKTENLNLLDRQSPSKLADTSVERQIIFSLSQ
jgi:hypothetical protein